MTGAWPSEEIDHINLNKADNRWCNLREATHRDNMINVHARKPSGSPSSLKGAYRSTRADTWFSQIRINGKAKRLGTFGTAQEAHAAYCAAAAKYHRSFSRTSSAKQERNKLRVRSTDKSISQSVRDALAAASVKAPRYAEQQSVRRDNSAGVTGVRLQKKSGRYEANVTIGGKQIHLGTFASLDEAKTARGHAAKLARTLAADK